MKSHPSRDLLQAEKLDVVATVLFCDVAPYARPVPDLSPEKVIASLNNYLTVIVDTLKEHHGTVANFIGEAVLAYWLADEHPDHATQACRFAYTLRGRLAAASCNFATAIGIHTGRIALVSIDRGASQWLTPMGASVNLANRLAGLCAHYQARALASDQVMAHATVIGWDIVETISIKGRVEPVTLHKLI